MTAIRPVARDVLRGVVIAVMALAISGTTLALRATAEDAPFTLTRDGIQLAQPFEDNGHLNVRTDAGVTLNIHAESKCISRTDAECAGQRHEIAQYIGAAFIPWSVIGVPADSCVVWVQRSGANYHYGEHGEPAFCLTEEEPCPTPTPTTPTTPTAPPVEPSPEPSVEPEPTEIPSGSPSPSESPTTTSPSSPTPTESPAESPTPSEPSPTSSPTSSAPTTPTTTGPSASEDYNQGDDEPTYTSDVSAVDQPAVLATTGINLAPWWIGIAILAIAVGGWLLHLTRPSKGDE